MKVFKKAVSITNGKKTESVGIIMVLFQLLLMLKPDLINTDTERVINLIIGSGVLTTLGHRIWRNRKEIWKYIKDKINSLKRQKNK